ncbi:NAD(P)-dependent alcohol dehydrogenase [Luteimonas vadosa]|uniref:NAD(P)-dependent alcohol dehydrogenase n=1 Tax=Luteimonas vadosa TaxID=1165507 RepID=A0ABP9E0P0_9GAMM
MSAIGAPLPAWRVRRGGGIASLALGEGSPRRLDAHSVRVRVEAVALNHRDLLVADGRMGTGDFRVPCSDAAGEVVEVGDAVTRFRIGDRVMPMFFPDWIDGAPQPPNVAQALGGNIDGVLQGELVVPAQALVAVPPHLCPEEAATLPCAALTAWHALFETGGLRAGQRVLVLGTGGVAIWALQLAKAAGAHVTLVSSDDAKLARARSLGADATVHYRQVPAWDDAVRRHHEGRGVDLVVETGGSGTIARSIAATRLGGTIALVGGVAGGFDVAVDAFALVGKRLAGVLVGSRAMAERLCDFVALARLRPAIDRVFAFEHAADAFAHLATGRHVGKVVVLGPGMARARRR